MAIHLPEDVERSIREAVQSGRFPSVDDAVTAAWLAFDAQSRRTQPTKPHPTANAQDELHRQMLADGLISRIPPRPDAATYEEFPPIAVEGEPLSETIIRERR